MLPTSRTLRLTLYTLLIIAGAAIAAALAIRHAERQALEEDATRASQQLALYANSLHTLIDRYRALPAVLALDPQLRGALAGPVGAEQQNALNLKLEQINGAAQSSTLELLDHTGLAVAASNWRLPSSYVGHNYGFRPYFSQTRTQGSGRFYAVGVTSGIPGYFLSSAVLGDNAEFLGAMVVKLEFPSLSANGARAVTRYWLAMRAGSSSSPTSPAGAIARYGRWTAATWPRSSVRGSTTNNRWSR